jgi:polyhydroxyalkanoate synthesis repressor PhaR
MAEPVPGPGVRLIKRYANRKLYDTGSGELTSLRRIEELVRNGVDIRVVDHDTGEDMTGEVLVGILGNSVGEQPGEGAIPLLTTLIRAPGDLLAAMFKDDQRTEELRAMGERVRLLSATIDTLLNQMEPAAGDEAPAPPKPAAASKTAKKPPPKRSSPASAPSRRR